MKNLNEDGPLDAKLLITFPESSEDHRLQLVGINGAIFAILFASLESLGPVRLNCEDWSLILLAPIKSKSNIVVSAINVICLNEIVSEEGNVNVHASNRLVKFGDLFQSPEKVCELGEKGEFQSDDDPGALLYYHRLFDNMISSIRSESPDSLSQAQQQVISSLCTLADKIEGKPENLNLQKVLSIWNIPQLRSDCDS